MAQEKIFQLADKVVKLFGNQDEDYFRVFTESLETRSDLSAQEKEAIKEKIRKDPSMILD